MSVRIVLVDLNRGVVDAWRRAFASEPEVTIVHGSLLAQRVSAWVTPTNGHCRMDGGVDAAVRAHLGGAIQARVRREVRERYGNLVPVGHAVLAPTGRTSASWLVATPTMETSSQDVSATMNVALACCAAFQAVAMHNALSPVAPIVSVAMPGLGAGTGRVPADVCAELMWAAYNLFREQSFADFDSMRAALEDEVGVLGPTSNTHAARAMRAAIHGTRAAVA